MNVRDCILAYLRTVWPEGADDRQLTEALAAPTRQQVNLASRQLRTAGLIKRRADNGTFINFAAQPIPMEETDNTAEEPAEPWYWEGNVLAAAGAFLKAQGFTDLRFRGTPRLHGTEIEAEKEGGRLHVAVIGWPEEMARAQPSAQAGLWFEDGLFGLLVWRGEDQRLDLAYALPDLPKYRKLAAEVAWLKPTARFSYLWVSKDGPVVRVTLSRPDEPDRSVPEEEPEPQARQMKLHEAIALILREQPEQTASFRFLADEIRERGLYLRGDNEPASANQLHARVRRYPRMFRILPGAEVRLKDLTDSTVDTRPYACEY